MRQLTSRYVPQQSQFECLIQGDSTHETGSFDPWIYLWGLAIQKPAFIHAMRDVTGSRCTYDIQLRKKPLFFLGKRSSKNCVRSLVFNSLQREGKELGQPRSIRRGASSVADKSSFPTRESMNGMERATAKADDDARVTMAATLARSFLLHLHRLLLRILCEIPT